MAISTPISDTKQALDWPCLRVSKSQHGLCGHGGTFTFPISLHKVIPAGREQIFQHSAGVLLDWENFVYFFSCFFSPTMACEQSDFLFQTLLCPDPSKRLYQGNRKLQEVFCSAVLAVCETGVRQQKQTLWLKGTFARLCIFLKLHPGGKKGQLSQIYLNWSRLCSPERTQVSEAQLSLVISTVSHFFLLLIPRAQEWAVTFNWTQ